MGIQAPRADMEKGSDNAKAYLNVHLGSNILLLGFVDLVFCLILIADDLARLMAEKASIKRLELPPEFDFRDFFAFLFVFCLLIISLFALRPLLVVLFGTIKTIK
jgi:hypothetical protein